MTNEQKGGTYMATATDEEQKHKDASAKEGGSNSHSTDEKHGMAPERTPIEKSDVGAAK